MHGTRDNHAQSEWPIQGINIINILHAGMFTTKIIKV